MIPIPSELLTILACPDCGANLEIRESTIHCTECRRMFQIQNGIPLLYPENLDIAHLREETLLAEMMQQSQTSTRAEFNASQWAQAKEDFWHMVERQIGEPPRKMLYVGCGYDPGFQRFQNAGHLFINLDLIMDMLDTLKNQYQANACIAGDMNALPFQKGVLDAVIVIDVIHHETDRLKPILQSFSQLLKPRGHIFLEDINAWGIYQFGKSILMPKPVYRWARKFYHKFKHSHYPPADYEFPTSYWQIRRMLTELGFGDIQAHPTNAYPYLNDVNYRFYRLISKNKYVPRYFNYHYMLSAVKTSNPSDD